MTQPGHLTDEEIAELVAGADLEKAHWGYYIRFTTGEVLVSKTASCAVLVSGSLPTDCGAHRHWGTHDRVIEACRKRVEIYITEHEGK